MIETPTISKRPPAVPSMNYRRLHQEGIRHIERLGNRAWTDFNIHDPGITILDVLCYAITDLGYRTDFELPDLLAAPKSKNGQNGSSPMPEKQFFSAAEILSCHPVTELDFRKILIDLKDVKNAWLSKSLNSEQDIMLFSIKNLIEYLRTRFQIDFISNYGADVGEGGFKNAAIQVLIEVKTLLGSLNRKIRSDWLSKIIDLIAETINSIKAKPNNTSVKVIENLIIELAAKTETMFMVPFCNLDFGSVPELKIQLNGLYNILLELDDHLDPENPELVEDVQNDALRRLHQYRNLCEDFLNIKVVENVPIGICTNLVIEDDSEEEEVLAQVFLNINRYLSPSLNFYSLEEMWERKSVYRLTEQSFANLSEKGLPAQLLDSARSLLGIPFHGKQMLVQKLQETFTKKAYEEWGELVIQQVEVEKDSDLVLSGPILENGFLDDEELAEAGLRQKVFKSDIYQLIMDVPGVKSIQNLALDKCHLGKDGSLCIKGDHWCLIFKNNCKPKLDYFCSRIQFSKGRAYTKPDIGRAVEILDLLTAKSIKAPVVSPQDIPVPVGEYRELTDYLSVQEEFPLVYGVGSNGIPEDNPSPERQAQAKQLKGFLLFFDQLLANYLAQLAEVRNLLSVCNEEEATAFFQPVYEAPNVQKLLLDFEVPSGGDEQQLWKIFVSDPDNDYIKRLQKILESDSLRLRRRNGLLDHLIARFGEHFTDYALKRYKISQQVDPALLYADPVEEIVADKKALLKNIPAISSERAKGFDYKARKVDEPKPDVWDTLNVSGLKKRVIRLLGLKDASRKLLTCLPGLHLEPYPLKKNWKFRLFESKDAGGYMLESSRSYRSSANATKAGENAIELVKEEQLFSAPPADDSEDPFCIFLYEINAVDAEGKGLKSIAQSPLFYHLEEYESWWKKLTKLATPDCDPEGFHIVEHILLRPKDDDYLPLLKPDFCACCMDPYSFWITVVVPDWWWDKNENREQRYWFGQLLRSELPAHIAARICWLGAKEMFAFESAYHDWLWELAQPEPDPYALRDCTIDLVENLNGLDCDCGKTEKRNPPPCPPPCPDDVKPSKQQK